MLQSKASRGAPPANHLAEGPELARGSIICVLFVSTLSTRSITLLVIGETIPMRYVPGSTTLLPTLKAKGTSAFIRLCAEAVPAVMIRAAAAVAT